MGLYSQRDPGGHCECKGLGNLKEGVERHNIQILLLCSFAESWSCA